MNNLHLHHRHGLNIIRFLVDNIIKETDESESALNDGNQNNRECINEKHDLEENRNFVVQLKELFAEYQHQMATVQTELKRAHKYDDMQREVSF